MSAEEWASERPTESGWYWCHFIEENFTSIVWVDIEDQIAQIFGVDGHNNMDDESDCTFGNVKWSGPFFAPGLTLPEK